MSKPLFPEQVDLKQLDFHAGIFGYIKKRHRYDWYGEYRTQVLVAIYMEDDETWYLKTSVDSHHIKDLLVLACVAQQALTSAGKPE